MKGRPLQITAVDALNRLMDSAALKNAPPISYDKDDASFGQTGGPRIHPNAMWETLGQVQAHTEIGGDPGTLLGIFSQTVNLYSELTGILPSRLGAQTVSHTTAFAKDAELQRGAVRTVDYVNSAGQEPITRWLDMAYQIGLKSFKGDSTMSFYIDSYGGFVEIGRKDLPDQAVFQWFGSGGPAEQQQKIENRIQGLTLASDLEQTGIALEEPAFINRPAAAKQILRQSGWTDISSVVNETEPQVIPEQLPLALPAPEAVPQAIPQAVVPQEASPAISPEEAAALQAIQNAA